MRAYLKTYFYENYSVYSNFYAEFRSVGIFEISFTVQRISVKAFTFFNSAWRQCGAFLIKKQLLCVETFVEWAVVKINHFCFLLQEAEIQSYLVMFNYHILER